MTAPQILASLGFTHATVVSEAKGKVCVRIWTTIGWVYDRFDKARLEDEITAWARKREPGVWL